MFFRQGKDYLEERVKNTKHIVVDTYNSLDFDDYIKHKPILDFFRQDDFLFELISRDTLRHYIEESFARKEGMLNEGISYTETDIKNLLALYCKESKVSENQVYKKIAEHEIGLVKILKNINYLLTNKHISFKVEDTLNGVVRSIERQLKFNPYQIPNP